MEEWRDVPGFNSLYQINISTKEGCCRRVYKNGKIKILKNGIHKRDKRIFWHLSLKGKSNLQQAARWIAFTYPELVQNEYFEGAEIDHIDTDRLNNHPSNLRWVTPKENSNNPLTKLHYSNAGFNKQGISRKILKLNKDGEVLSFYPSIREAERKTKISNTAIHNCLTGRSKSAGGYKWRYA